MPPRAFFDHLFKTAGTSLQTILIGHYGRENLCRADGYTAATALAMGRNFPLIAGHVQHTKGVWPFRERACFALLRHPVERAFSAYSHLRRHPMPNADPAVRAAHALTLEQFVAGDAAETSIVRDFQTRHFAEMGAGAEGDSPLDAAKAALLLYHAVGVQEEFPLAARLVCRILDLPDPEAIPFENVGGHADASAFTSSVRRAIERANANDIALWEWARDEARRMDRGRARPLLPAGALFAQSVHDAAAPALPKLRREDLGGVELLQVLVEPLASGRVDGTPFETAETVCVRVLVQALQNVSDLTIGLRVSDAFRHSIFETNSFHLGVPLALAPYERTVVDFTMLLNLGVGAYAVDVSGHRGQDESQGLFFWRDEACAFDVINRSHPFFRGISYLPLHVTCAPASAATLWMSPIDDVRLGVRLRCALEGLALRAGATGIVPVLLHNASAYELSSYPPAPMMLSYHITDRRDEVVVFDGERTAFSAPIGSGEERGILLNLRAPDEPGSYLVTPHLLQEGLRWFDAGEETCPVKLEVYEGRAAGGST